MAQLNNFTGGLLTKASPFLIDTSNSVIYSNVNLDKGSINAENQDITLDTYMSEKFVRYNNSWYSSSVGSTNYAIYDDFLIMDATTGAPRFTNVPKGIYESNLGMLKDNAPVLMPTVEINYYDQAGFAPSINYSFSGTTTHSTSNVLYYAFFYGSWGGTPVVKPILIYGPVIGDVTITISSLPSEYTKWMLLRYVEHSPVNGQTEGVKLYEGTNTSVTDDFTLKAVNTYPYPLYEYRLAKGKVEQCLVEDIDSSGNKSYKKFTYTPTYDSVIFIAYPIASNRSIYRLIANDPFGSGNSGKYMKCRYMTYPSVNPSYLVDDGTFDGEVFIPPSNNFEVSYCTTQYNSNLGWEGPPSPVSKVDNLFRVMVFPSTFSYSVWTDKVRIYRLGGLYTDFMLVGEVNIGSMGAFTDDIFKAPTGVLSSQENSPCPTGVTNFTIQNAMVFGSKENILYYSDVAYIYAWSPYNFIAFDDTIIGMGKTANGLIVFTKTSTFIVTGTSPSTLSKYLVTDQQGCIAHSTIQPKDNGLIWLSDDGICITNGSAINLLTWDKLGILTLTGSLASLIYNNTYYISHSGGTLCIKLDSMAIYTLDIITTCFGVADNVLYYRNQSGYLTKAFQSSAKRTLSYKSPKYSDGSTTILKNYNNIYVNSTGNLTLTIYITDIQVLSVALTPGINDIAIPQGYRLGYWVQFEVIGTGELFEIEYKVEGRQNGR